MKQMIGRRNFFAIVLISLVTPLTGTGATVDAATEKEKIEKLIRHVEGLKGATFIRNGKPYSAENASKFLRGKWQNKEKEIKTAGDFIAKAASVSSTTGKPYIIRFADGKESKCGEYLMSLLK